MATTNLVHLIASEIGRALVPLRDAIASPAAFEAFMLQLGWTAQDVPPPIKNLGTALDHLDTAVRKIITGDPSVTDFADLLQAIRALIDAVNGLRTATFDPALAAAGFAEKFPGQVIEYLIIQHLMFERPRTAFLLSALGVIRSTYIDAASADHHDHVRRELVWADFPKLLRDPVQLFENAFGWRTEHLAHEVLLRAATNLAISAGLQASFEQIDRKLFQLLEQQDPPPGAPDRMGVDIALFQRMGQDAELAAGLKLLGLRPDGPRLPGFALLPYVTGEFNDDVEIDSRRTLTIRSTLDLAGGLGLVLRPETGLTVFGGLDASSSSTLAEGDVLVKVIDRDRSGDPTVLIGAKDASRLEYKTLSISAGARLESLTEADLFAEIQLDEARLVVKAGEGDSFLRTILPEDGITADFDLAPGISLRQGFYFRGSARLEVNIPAHRTFGPIELRSVTIGVGQSEGDDGIPINLGATVSAKLGPLTAVVDNVGLTARFSFPDDNSGALGPLDVDFGFKPPNGVGLSIDGGGFKGGGFLRFERERAEYSGTLELEFQDQFTLKAVGLLTTRLPAGEPGFSLLIVISSEFTPIQLGLGFALSGVGGLLGLNRTVAIDRLVSGLRDQTLGSVLFPTDVVANADRIISDLRQIFPPARGRFVFGPMARITWGTPALLTADIGLLLEVPDPVRLAILGIVRAIVPDERAAILRVQVNFLGVIDFDQEKFSFDASLFDSKLLAFTLTGDMAMRLYWGDDANFLLTVGGFHPAYQPPPMGLPALRRLTIALIDGDNPRLTLETYLAVTSNTVQLGARLELYAAAWKFNVCGFLSFDVLFQFNPFYFVAEVTAMLDLRVGSSSIASIKLTLTLEGPTPWKAKGDARLRLCWFLTVKIRFNKTFGDTRNTTLPDLVVLPLVVQALTARDNWIDERRVDGHRLESLRELPPVPGDPPIVHPVGLLAISQKVVPLNLAIDRLGSQRPADARTFAISEVHLGTDLVTPQAAQESFAPAQFFDMTDEEKLARPSFQRFDSGVRLGEPDRLHTGYAAAREVQYEVKYIDSQRDRQPARPGGSFTPDAVAFNSWTLQGAIARSDLSFSRRRKSALAPDEVGLRQETFAVVRKSDMRLVDEHSLLGTEQGAIARRAALIAANPGLRDSLQVVPAFELVA